MQWEWAEVAFWSSITGLVTWAFLHLTARPRKCPKCRHPLPKYRIPTSIPQAAHGGWTCPKCGTEVDGDGREV